MSNLVFPALPLQSPRVDVRSDFATIIHTAASGKEQRTSLRVAPRRRFKVRFPALRQNVQAPVPHGAYSEVGVIEYFWEVHRGEWDSFLYWDINKNTGAAVQRRVRFAKEPELSRLFFNVWEGEVELLEVL